MDSERALHLLQWRCKRAVDHLLAGEYRSVFKGRGLEYEDARPYEQGDDLRSVDWKMTARSGSLHVRRHVEERENAVYLMVDVSGSLRCASGGRSKESLAAEITMLLSLAAQRVNDRVGMLMFSDRIEKYIPPKRSRSHALRLVDELLSLEPQSKGTSLCTALEFIGHAARKRSIIFILSDFKDATCQEHLAVLGCKHEVLAIQLTDERDRFFPDCGWLRLKDAESNCIQLVKTSGPAGWAYTDHAQQWQKQLVAQLREAEVDWLQLDTEDEPAEKLAAYFHFRRRRLADESGG